MRQRVELARALGGGTDLLLMDEPFSSVDYLTRLKLRAELARLLREQPRTVVLVTHDIEEAAQLADRVLVLSERPARIRDEVRLSVAASARPDASRGRRRGPPHPHRARPRRRRRAACRRRARRGDRTDDPLTAGPLGPGSAVARGRARRAPHASRGNAPRRAATVAQDAEPRETLAVGFLPVTCHLTCPVTDFASKTSPSTRFESQRFTDFPTVVETMKSGRLQASFMIAPLAMKLREQGVKVKIAYLGHRDGSTVMVRSDLTQVKSLKDLKGMTFAIPNKASNQNLVIRKLMKDEGLSPDDIRFVELPPPDMPGALATRAIDAYFIGEPHAARAELDGTGRILYHAKDIWPHFISCVLVVTEQLIERAARRRAGPGARHRRKRRVGREPPARGRQAGVAVLPPGRKAAAPRADAAARSRQLSHAHARPTTRCSASPTWRSTRASSNAGSTSTTWWTASSSRPTSRRPRLPCHRGQALLREC